MRSEHWHYRLSLFKERLSNCPKNGILFLGDSITEEFSLHQYFPKFPVINSGISGDTIDGVIERLDISAIQLKPAKLFLMIGVNDIGSNIEASYIQSQYSELITLLQNNLPGIKLFVQSILPCRIEWGKQMIGQIKKNNQFIENICRKKNIQFINLYNFFIDLKDHLKEDLTRDGLHLNKNGYDLWAKQLKQSIQPETTNEK